MKKFIQDFKKFIAKGNIIDMAIGVIVGNAFSAIVKALTDKIIMPLINYLLALGGADGLSSAFTFLKKATLADGTIDLANSIYIDWGAFITAIINFFIIALTLFVILKVAMKSRQFLEEAADKMFDGVDRYNLTKEDRKELKKRGVAYKKDKVAVAAYLQEKKDAEEAKRKAEEEAKKAKEEEAKRNTTEYILKEIRDLLAKNAEDKKHD